MKLLAVVIAVFVISFLMLVFEESPYPIPGPPISGQTEEQHRSGATQEESKEYSPSGQAAPTVDETKSKPSALIRIDKDNDKGQPTAKGNPEQSTAVANYLVAIFTGVLAAAAVVQLFIYARQARYMRQGLEVTRKSADAAKESAEVAGRALEVVERASLFVENWTYNICHGNQVPAGLFCTLHNTGRTAATLTEGAVCLDVCEGMPFRPEFESLSPTYKGPFTVQVQETLKHGLPFTAERWKEVKATIHGNWEIYLYGYITYTDEFRGRHHIRFCLKGERRGQLIPVGEGGYNYHVTEEKKNIEYRARPQSAEGERNWKQPRKYINKL